MIHLDYGRLGTLSKTGDRTDGELAVNSGQQELVGLVAVGFVTIESKAQLKASALEEVARSSRMAGRASANADRVLPLRLEIEERVKSRNAVNASQRHLHFVGDVAQGFQRKIFV